MSNIYGPGDHLDDERAHAVGGMIKRMLEAKRDCKPQFVVYGTGKPVREWLYIDDAIDALLSAISVPPIEGVLNIGEKKGYSIKETAEIIKKFVGYDGDLIFDEKYPDGAYIKTVDGKFARGKLNWRPKTDFVEGIKKTVEWYRLKIDLN